MAISDKPLIWLHGEIKTPPLSSQARLEAGFLLRLLQQGQKLSLPHSRPMPSIGHQCHELRINDHRTTWRIVYCVAEDAIIILAVFQKKSQQTPKYIIEVCQQRLRKYEQVSGE